MCMTCVTGLHMDRNDAQTRWCGKNRRAERHAITHRDNMQSSGMVASHTSGRPCLPVTGPSLAASCPHSAAGPWLASCVAACASCLICFAVPACELMQA